MYYARIIVNILDINEVIDKLNLKKKNDFAFYDSIYLNNNGSSLTDDTLKIRVYQINEWNTKDVLVIRKTAPLKNGVKEDKILVNKEFDTLEEAKDFVDKNFGSLFTYKFKIAKSGSEYVSDKLHMWVEEIDDLGISIEFGSSSQEFIEEVIKLFDVKERLQESIPEYIYKKFN